MALNVGTSIVDYLKSIGQDSSFPARAQLAAQFGIQNYTGTEDQNVQLLSLVRGQGAPSTQGGASSNQDLLQQLYEAERRVAEVQSDLDKYKASQTQTSLPQVTATKDEILAWVRQQPEYKNLSREMQDTIISYVDILGIQDKDTWERIMSSLTLAQSQADPYFAEILRMTVDTMKRASGTLKGDYESQIRNIQKNLQELREDLAIGKGRLSIDEQAELARLQRKYEIELDTLRDQAAQVGLTFSTRRELAEGRLSAEQTDIVESTQRAYQRQLENLQRAASRGEITAQHQLADYERKYQEAITGLCTSRHPVPCCCL